MLRAIRRSHVDHTDAHNDFVGCFGRSDRSALQDEEVGVAVPAYHRHRNEGPITGPSIIGTESRVKICGLGVLGSNGPRPTIS